MRTAQVYNKFQQVYDWANDSKINFKQKGKPEIYEKYKNDKQVNVNRFFFGKGKLKLSAMFLSKLVCILFIPLFTKCCLGWNQMITSFKLSNLFLFLLFFYNLDLFLKSKPFVRLPIYLFSHTLRKAVIFVFLKYESRIFYQNRNPILQP